MWSRAARSSCSPAIQYLASRRSFAFSVRLAKTNFSPSPHFAGSRAPSTIPFEIFSAEAARSAVMYSRAASSVATSSFAASRARATSARFFRSSSIAALAASRSDFCRTSTPTTIAPRPTFRRTESSATPAGNFPIVNLRTPSARSASPFRVTSARSP